MQAVGWSRIGRGVTGKFCGCYFVWPEICKIPLVQNSTRLVPIFSIFYCPCNERARAQISFTLVQAFTE
jgi:hypothetical protein